MTSVHGVIKKGADKTKIPRQSCGTMMKQIQFAPATEQLFAVPRVGLYDKFSI
jgi:hypothetical protein